MEPVAVKGQQIHAHFSYASSHCSQLSFMLTSFVLLQSVPRCPFSCSLLMCFFILFLGVLFHAHFSYASSYCSQVSFSMLTSHVLLHTVPRCPDPCSLLIYFFILFVGVLFHSHFSFASSLCSMLTSHMLFHTVHKCPFHAPFSCVLMCSHTIPRCPAPCSLLIYFFKLFVGDRFHAHFSFASSQCSQMSCSMLSYHVFLHTVPRCPRTSKCFSMLDTDYKVRRGLVKVYLQSNTN